MAAALQAANAVTLYRMVTITNGAGGTQVDKATALDVNDVLGEVARLLFGSERIEEIRIEEA